MILHNAAITGSLTVNGTDVSSITGSSTYSASFAAQIASINTATSSLNSYTSSNNTTISALNAQTASLLAYTSSNDVKVAGLNTFSSSILSYTASNDANVTSLFANVTSLSAGSASSAFNVNALSNFSASMLAYTSSANTKFAGLDAASGSAITRLSSLENRTGSYATTGSNTFVNSQYISALNDATGFTTTASLYTDGGFRVTKDAYLSSSLYIKGNLTVYGTQSVSYITSSQLNISTNLITVNTDTPAVRFGGLSVYDSGSTGLTGSMLWDSQNNHWVYSNPSGSSYSGGMFISGPRTATLGSEQGTSACMLLAGQGGDHLTSSMIYHSSTVTCIPNTLVGGVGCFSGAVCSNGNVLIGGSGTCNYLPKFTGASTIGNSIVQDNSTGIIINGTDNYTAQNGGWFFNGAGSYTNGIFASSSSNNLTLRAPQVMSFESGGALRMTLDASGNLGLGVTPSSWTTSSSARALQLNAGSLFSFLTSQLHLEQNSYFNSGFFYVNNGLASAYRQVDGVHLWLNAPSGTANCAITFTQTMTLNACGRLILGNTTDNTYSRLQVAGGAWIGQNAGRGLYFADGASYTSVVGLNQAVNTYNAVELRASGVDGQLFLATSGNVGVGTTSVPSDHILQVHSSCAYARMALTNTSTGVASGDGLIFQMENNFAIIKNQETNCLVLGTNGRETDIVIGTNGGVGIGQSPINKFTILAGNSNVLDLFDTGAGFGIGMQAMNSAATVYRSWDFYASKYQFFAGPAIFSCAVCAPRVFLNNCNAGAVLSIANADSTNDAGVRGLAIATDRLRFGVSPVTSTYGAIATNGTNSGITFVTYDTSWVERARIECTGVTSFICQVCAASFIANGDFNIRNSVFSTTGTLNKVTWTNLYPSTYNVADIGVQLDGNYYNGAIIFRTADADNANVLVERMRMESRGVTCFRNTVCAPIFTQNQSGVRTLSIVKSVNVSPSSTGYMTVDMANYMGATFHFVLDVTAGAYGNSASGPGVFKFVFGGYYSTAAAGSCVVLANDMTCGSWAWNRSGTVYCIAITNNHGTQDRFSVAKFDITFCPTA